MERLRDLFRQLEFHVLLFCLSIVVLSWPLVSFSDVERVKATFTYVFLVWAAIILLLRAVGCSLNDSTKKHTSEGSKE